MNLFKLIIIEETTEMKIAVDKNAKIKELVKKEYNYKEDNNVSPLQVFKNPEDSKLLYPSITELNTCPKSRIKDKMKEKE